jgi:hypothetical protein
MSGSTAPAKRFNPVVQSREGSPEARRQASGGTRRPLDLILRTENDRHPLMQLDGFDIEDALATGGGAPAASTIMAMGLASYISRSLPPLSFILSSMGT